VTWPEATALGDLGLQADLVEERYEDGGIRRGEDCADHEGDEERHTEDRSDNQGDDERGQKDAR
jgi:hypothetical protein